MAPNNNNNNNYHHRPTPLVEEGHHATPDDCQDALETRPLLLLLLMLLLVPLPHPHLRLLRLNEHRVFDMHSAATMTRVLPQFSL